MNDESLLEKSQLGKNTDYTSAYNPQLLFPIARQLNREEIGITHKLPFYGVDIWNHYEVSWLNAKGKPQVALAEIIYDCHSPNIIESKSMKLYFNSLNNTKIKTLSELREMIARDLTQAVGMSVTVNIISLSSLNDDKLHCGFEGMCIDECDVACDEYLVNAALLKTDNSVTDEILFSNLLKSNCPVTNQPDWASVQISYKGKKINNESLLKYIVSYRNHNEFHEQCIERIFVDIMQHCQPKMLTVYGRFTRRGGLDINPIRSTEWIDDFKNLRLIRQ